MCYTLQRASSLAPTVCKQELEYSFLYVFNLQDQLVATEYVVVDLDDTRLDLHSMIAPCMGGDFD